MDVLEAAWTHVNEGWDEPARHDELLRLVDQHDAYAWAAGKYKAAVAERGDDIAKRHLERIRRSAEARLFVRAAARPTTERAPYRSIVLVLVLFVVAALAGIVIMRSIADWRSQPASAPPQPTGK